MPLITDLKPTKKGRLALFCDGEFKFSLGPETIFDKKLEIGQRLEDYELAELSRLADLQKAVNKALLLLGHRPHSESELSDKLRKDYDRHTTALVIDKMRDYGYVDDGAYAEEALRNLIPRKNLSYRAAVHYLEERGIETSQMEDELNRYASGELDRISAIIDKSYASKLCDQRSRDNTVAALARRGFSISDIKRVLARYVINEEDE